MAAHRGGASITGWKIMNRSLSLVSTVMGCLLILVGIGLLIFHIIKASQPPVLGPAKVGVSGIEPRTSYPGIFLIAIGAAMVMAGAATAN
jgi:hypothetical protein